MKKVFGIQHFAYDRNTDTWQWNMDGEDNGKFKPFARVILTKKVTHRLIGQLNTLIQHLDIQMKKNNNFSIFILILLFSQTLFTQTKLDEADKLIQQLERRK